MFIIKTNEGRKGRKEQKGFNVVITLIYDMTYDMICHDIYVSSGWCVLSWCVGVSFLHVSKHLLKVSLKNC